MTDPSEVIVTRKQASAFNKAMDDAFEAGTDFIGALQICLARFVAERVPDASDVSKYDTRAHQFRDAVLKGTKG